MKNSNQGSMRFSGFFAAGIAAVLITAAAVSAVSSDLGPGNQEQSLQNQQHLREILTRELEIPVNAPLNIRNETGRVSIIGWDGDTVAIRAEKRLNILDEKSSWIRARLGPPAGLKIEDLAFFDSMDLKTNLDERGLNISSLRDPFAPDVTYTFNIEIKVPRATPINVHVENGPLNIQGIKAPVTAETGNGKLACADISGPVHARTRNGGIYLRAIEGPIAAQATNGPVLIDGGEMSTTYAIHCETDNGAIKLNLPSNPSFELAAQTSNGYVKTHFKVNGEAPSGAIRSLTGSVGRGGPTIELSTLNGSIHLDESQ